MSGTSLVGVLPEIDGFRLLEELGSGALSSVYAALEESLGRKVAIKVLKGTIAQSSPFAMQLEREAHILGELCHPNIGLIHAFLKSPGRMVLVLELVDGFSLAALLKKKPTVPSAAVPAIGAAIARGLAHAHARGIVHRDVKPGNIMLGRSGSVKLLDFGIAQHVQTREEPQAVVPVGLEGATAFGTPAYMSPEQILGESVDGRSDLFALGVVLYQLVCGARPFERGDGEGGRPAAHRIRRDPPIPLHRRAPDVAPALERIIMRAIEKLPADRFQTATSMAERLEELAGPAPGLSGDRSVVRALEAAGLIRAGQSEPALLPSFSGRASLRRAVLGLAAVGACGVAGGAILQQSPRATIDGGGATQLELVPPAPGFLRVLATPWAEVWVDGQRVDVTPFARAIPLSAGTHYVTLTHPSAPTERRAVAIVPGETRTLDAVMAVGAMPVKNETKALQPSAERDRGRR